MSSPHQDDGKLVRHFRQILLWPLQLVPIREGEQIQQHWELLSREGTDNPWGEVRDEFSCAPGEFKERHYSEFVTFLPYVRRFLYGEAKGRGAAGATESPIRVFRRRDVARVRVALPGRAAPVTLDVAHVDLCYFYDIDVMVLVVEIAADNLDLATVQDTIYRLGRAYPTYWHEDGTGGHCVLRAEWLAADGTLLAASDYEQRDQYLAFVGQYRAPRFAAHWEFLLRPLVPDASGARGIIRYRQVEYSRMPLLAYVAISSASRSSPAPVRRIRCPIRSATFTISSTATASTSSGTSRRAAPPARASCPAGTRSSSSATRTSRFSSIAKPGYSGSSGTSISCCS